MGLDNDLVLLDLNVLDMDISANCPWSRTTYVAKIGIGIELQFLAAITQLGWRARRERVIGFGRAVPRRTTWLARAKTVRYAPASVQNVSNSNFGPLIAYLVPGATVLLGFSLFSPVLRSWFAATPADVPTTVMSWPCMVSLSTGIIGRSMSGRLD